MLYTNNNIKIQTQCCRYISCLLFSFILSFCCFCFIFCFSFLYVLNVLFISCSFLCWTFRVQSILYIGLCICMDTICFACLVFCIYKTKCMTVIYQNNTISMCANVNKTKRKMQGIYRYSTSFVWQWHSTYNTVCVYFIYIQFIVFGIQVHCVHAVLCLSCKTQAYDLSTIKIPLHTWICI